MFLSISELTEILNLPRSFVYEHTRKGSPDPLPAFKFGKHLRFKKDEVETWIEKHRKQ